MALLRAGYPILKSLELIAGRTKNVHLKELLLKVEAEIRSGKALSEAFAPFEKNFTKVYTASLMAGEQSGNLPGTIGAIHRLCQGDRPDQIADPLRPHLSHPPPRLSPWSCMGILVNFILPRFSGFLCGLRGPTCRWSPGSMASPWLRASVRRRPYPDRLVILASVLPRLKKQEKRSSWLWRNSSSDSLCPAHLDRNGDLPLQPDARPSSRGRYHPAPGPAHRLPGHPEQVPAEADWPPAGRHPERRETVRFPGQDRVLQPAGRGYDPHRRDLGQPARDAE